MAVVPEHRAVVVDASHSPHARLRPVPIDAVALSDAFWAPRLRLNRQVTLPAQYCLCEETGRIDNVRRAAGKIDAPFRGVYFNDSDVYKWLEAAAWALAGRPEADLARTVDGLIVEIAAAQRPDGYLNTYFALDRAGERFTDFDKHELYCAGHLFQAAIAHYRATGATSLLDVATRFADFICDTFGPAEQGKRPWTDGHEEVELALVELSRATGARRYLDQARYFVDARGHGLLTHPAIRFDRAYYQDHLPFRELSQVTGHAVRMVYLAAGVADLYAETGEDELRAALDRLWEDMTARRMYVSGGIGARYEGEAFGKDYELPNARAYAETCAAIGSVMWNWRMLALDGEARYADLMEHTLYNAVLPGLSLDGQTYFYQNPLEDDGTHRRQPWFGVACCPPNLARLLASLPGYVYGVSAEAAWVHLYAEGTATIRLPDGQVVELRQATRYPWDGEVVVEVGGAGEFSLRLRIPAWCEGDATLEVNGHAADGQLVSGSYAEVRRRWRPGDEVRLQLPMSVRRIECHPYVAANANRVALMRGPLLYCVEGIDNPGVDVREIVLPGGSEIGAEFRPDLLGGVVGLTAEAAVAPPDRAWANRLYRPATVVPAEPGHDPMVVTAVPYYAWANREAGPMQVWLRTSH